MARIPTVHQFRIELLHVEPLIWRRILVPSDYTFWDLHVAIQDAMGWNDSHLHEFRVLPKHKHRPMRFGIPMEDDVEELPLAGWQYDIANFITLERPSFEYVYDFGDHWEHRVELEGILRVKSGERYPQCIAGERACPPDDCGGIPGYENLLVVLADPHHPERDELSQWVEGMLGLRGITEQFDPEKFDPGAVRFDNPHRRLRIASGGQFG